MEHDNVPLLEWRHLDFFAVLDKPFAVPVKRFALLVNQTLLDGLYGCTDERVALVQKFLLRTFFVKVHAMDIERPTESQHARFEQLLQTVGAMPTLVDATIDSIHEGCAQLSLVPVLSHVQKLSVCAGNNRLSEATRHALVHGLQAYASLNILKIKTSHELYPNIVSVLPTLSNLKKLCIDALFDPHTTAAAATAFFPSENPRLFVSIFKSNLSTEESCRAMYDGMSQSACKGIGLEISEIMAVSGAEIYNGLACSKCQALTFFWHVKGGNNLFRELDLMTAALPRMSHLESLAIYIKEDGLAMDDPIVQATGGAILRAAGKCRFLKQMRFSCMIYTKTIDEALEECLRDSPSLRLLDFLCWQVSECANGCPKLLQALEKNFIVQSIFLPNKNHPSLTWDSNVTKLAECWTKLNRAGRIYLRDDPDNNIRGLQVLEEVNADLDCLYLHLREKPMLCFTNASRVDAEMQGDNRRKKKRKHGTKRHQ